MSRRDEYTPGPAYATLGPKDGDNWTIVLVKELRHSPDKVWSALTDPEQLREWAPFEADRSMDEEGSKVNLTTVGAPSPHVTETEVTRAEAPKLLEYKWGGGDVRWELEPLGEGTRLTLWASINHRFVSMGAAGWHICLDVLDALLDGEPIGRFAGPDTMQFSGWQRLNGEYAKEFGVKPLSW